jgi:hypothetical protein
MARKIGLKGIRLINTLYMMVIVINSLWNEEIFKGQALEH